MQIFKPDPSTINVMFTITIGVASFSPLALLVDAQSRIWVSGQSSGHQQPPGALPCRLHHR